MRPKSKPACVTPRHPCPLRSGENWKCLRHPWDPGRRAARLVCWHKPQTAGSGDGRIFVMNLNDLKQALCTLVAVPVTPFDEQGGLDLPASRAVIDRIINGGI